MINFADKCKELARLKLALDESKARYELAIKSLKDKYDILSNEVRDMFQEAKIKSYSLDNVGTFTLVERKTASVSDIAELHDFILRNRALDLLENRVCVSALEIYNEKGIHIPGVRMTTVVKPRFMKAKE